MSCAWKYDLNIGSKYSMKKYITYNTCHATYVFYCSLSVWLIVGRYLYMLFLFMNSIIRFIFTYLSIYRWHIVKMLLIVSMIRVFKIWKLPKCCSISVVESVPRSCLEEVPGFVKFIEIIAVLKITL